MEICRQLAQAGMQVWRVARVLERVKESLRGDGDMRGARLDVADEDSILALALALAQRLGRLDVLVNNAAIDYDTDARSLTIDLDRVRRDLETNLFGPWRMAQAFSDRLWASAHGRLVNVSSGAGQISDMRAGTPAYSTSKLVLNGLTRILADGLRTDGVLVNAVCPDWTATDMGAGARLGVP